MNSPIIIFLLIFVGAPLGELYVLIEVGGEIGAIPTIALSIFTAVLGGLLVRFQGMSVLFRAQKAMSQQEMPAIELLEGAVLLLTGFALMLPGFITDAVGFLLLITPLRRALIIRHLRRRGTMQPGDAGVQRDANARSQGYIEGDYRRED